MERLRGVLFCLMVSFLPLSLSAKDCSDPKLIRLFLDSQLLDQKVRYHVIVPCEFAFDKSYGAVYFLHGRGNSADHFLDLGGLDRLQELWTDTDNHFLVVLPEGLYRDMSHDSYWLNGARTGLRWSDFVARELREHIEKIWPVGKTPRHRVIAGISMGGHGAIQIHLNHPGIYGAVAAHSPVFWTEEEIWRHKEHPELYPPGQSDFLVFGRGAEFRSRSPRHILAQFPEGFKQTPVWLDYGRDDFFIDYSLDTLSFINELSGQPQAILQVNSGEHSNTYWQQHLQDYVHWYAQQLPAPKKSRKVSPPENFEKTKKAKREK